MYYGIQKEGQQEPFRRRSAFQGCCHTSPSRMTMRRATVWLIYTVYSIYTLHVNRSQKQQRQQRSTGKREIAIAIAIALVHAPYTEKQTGPFVECSYSRSLYTLYIIDICLFIFGRWRRSIQYYTYIDLFFLSFSTLYLMSQKLSLRISSNIDLETRNHTHRGPCVFIM